MMRHRCEGSIGAARRGRVAALSIAGVALFHDAAAAKDLRFPEARPEVGLTIPDDWTIDGAKSLEAKSPEKNAIVVGDMIGRDKGAIDAWTKTASAKLKAFGITFDTDAKAPPPKAEAAATPVESESAFTKSPDKFSFTGAPSLAAPGTANSNNPVKPGPLSVESLTGFGTEVKVMPKLPFKAVQIYGTKLNGKPVDVQLLLFNVPGKRIFAMMQESGSDDGRTVAIAQSVRGAGTAAK